jgi:3-hydroxyacyl-CoA dehydrogenase / 3-hydroxy-2-methylbutyryl-CoA dehydrogenase
VRLFAQGLADGAPRSDLLEDRGVIVNTASVAAFEALSGQAAYGGSKAGVASMTLPLARELARLCIRVMATAPGTFETGMYIDIPEHTRHTLVADVPFPPRAGRPDEFAHMVRALIENQMMNGSVLRIDGAVRMREPVAPCVQGNTA